jgi:hypothetical protein
MAPRIREALKHYELRKKEDISWSELGRRVWRVLGEGGDSAKWVSRVKLGQQQPSVAEGGAIAFLLDVSPLWLFWEIGEMGRFPMPAEEALPIAAAVPAQSDAEKAAAKKPSRRGVRA